MPEITVTPEFIAQLREAIASISAYLPLESFTTSSTTDIILSRVRLLDGSIREISFGRLDIEIGKSVVCAANALPALLDEVERMRLELAAHLAVIHRLHAYAVADHEIVWRDIVAMLDEERAELKGSYHD